MATGYMQPVATTGVVALLQLVEGDVAPDLDVVVELDAVLGDPVDVQLDHVARQAEGRHADQVVPPPLGSAS